MSIEFDDDINLRAGNGNGNGIGNIFDNDRRDDEEDDSEDESEGGNGNNEGDEGDENDEDNEDNEDDEGDEDNEDNEDDEGDEGDEDNEDNEDDEGDEGDEDNEDNENDEGDEGDEDNEDNEDNEGDEGDEGNEDVDADGDGQIDADEAGRDTDNDGTPDNLDPDDDDDNVSSLIESLVPTIFRTGSLGTTNFTSIVGDGNGDGIADTLQRDVSSAAMPKRDGSSGDVYLTLVAGSVEGKPDGSASLSQFGSIAVTESTPENMDLPLGKIQFVSTVAQGQTQDFSLYVHGDFPVNGYWKSYQDSFGNTLWANLASEAYGGQMAEDGGVMRLDFSITDGGQFDKDGAVNGVIVDPGAPGFWGFTPIYRFWKPATESHFYTGVESEALELRKYPQDYVYEGEVFSTREGTVGMHRLFHEVLGHHFYSLNEQEVASAMAGGAYRYEGVAYQAFTAAQADTIAIHRFYNASNESHFYTTSEAEKAVVIGSLPEYQYEGIAGFLPTA